jgi:hypothetical protein
VPQIGAQGDHFGVGAKRGAQQAQTVQLLDPLAIQNIAFATRDMLEAPTVDQVDFEAARFEQIEDRNPVHPRGFHGDRVDATGHQPIRQGLQIDGEDAKDPHTLCVGGALGWDTRPNFAGADVQAGGVGMHDLQVLEGFDLLGGTALASHANSPLDEG